MDLGVGWGWEEWPWERGPEALLGAQGMEVWRLVIVSVSLVVESTQMALLQSEILENKLYGCIGVFIAQHFNSYVLTGSIVTMCWQHTVAASCISHTCWSGRKQEFLSFSVIVTIFWRCLTCKPWHQAVIFFRLVNVCKAELPMCAALNVTWLKVICGVYLPDGSPSSSILLVFPVLNDTIIHRLNWCN